MADVDGLQTPPDTAAFLKALSDQLADKLKSEQLSDEEVRRLKQVAEAFPNSESINAAAELAKNAAAIARVLAILKWLFGAIGISFAAIIAWFQIKLGIGGPPR